MTGRILVAGIGNIFLGDDGFGVEVARRLARCPLPEGVQVVDFGIRGLDLAYALLEDHEAVILVDIAPRGQGPGTLSLIEPRVEQQGEVTLDTHAMDPVKVLALARALGATPTRTLLVACEPAAVPGGDDDDVVVGLSAPVGAAVDEAVAMIVSLIAEELAASATPDQTR
jgi:hydrogenase maturation protease